MNRPRRRYLAAPEYRATGIKAPSAITPGAGDPHGLLTDAARRLDYAFQILNSMAQNGDRQAHKVLEHITAAIGSVKGAQSGIAQGDAVLPDPADMGRLD